MALGVLYEITLDATNPRSLAHFWEALIGGEVDTDGDDWASLDSDEVYLVFVRSQKRSSTTGIRLVVEVDDLESAIGFAEDLGAAREGSSSDTEEGTRQEMSDPSGHRFELVQQS